MAEVSVIEAVGRIEGDKIEAVAEIGNPVYIEVHDDVNLESLSVTENGTYLPDEGVDGFSDVAVDVPERQPVTEGLTVTENGTYTAQDVDGYTPVVVNVPERIPVTESLNVTQNGTYTPGTGIDGYSIVSVGVPPTTPQIEPLTVSDNGTYTASGDGFNPVVVDVPKGITPTGTKQVNVTANGTITEDVTDYANAEINVAVPIPVPSGIQFELIGQSTHVLAEYTNTSTAETIDTGIDITDDDHSFLLVVITCNDGTPAVENAWGGVYMDIATRYISTARVLASASGVFESGTKSLLMSEASGFGTSNNNGPIHIVSNVPTVRFIRRASNNGRTFMAGTYTVKVYGLSSL